MLQHAYRAGEAGSLEWVHVHPTGKPRGHGCSPQEGPGCTANFRRSAASANDESAAAHPPQKSLLACVRLLYPYVRITKRGEEYKCFPCYAAHSLLPCRSGLTVFPIYPAS